MSLNMKERHPKNSLLFSKFPSRALRRSYSKVVNLDFILVYFSIYCFTFSSSFFKIKIQILINTTL